ncbi:MAG: anti-sigma factor antagonist [Clostridia bacterium]|jgi:stage II sporulation protein AA (anti-sigma F factor antagonist)|nr:anti-sigma factor antagonist [Clostridia bacterium]MBQ3870596.1 anti-sigma factor antagonist [Clostridia bacterium]
MNGVTFREKDGSLIASLTGELDHCLAVSVRERIDAEFYKRMPKELLLDLSGVSFMDSSGLGLIMGRYSVCGNCGKGFALIGADERAVRILSLAGLDKTVAIRKE